MSSSMNSLNSGSSNNGNFFKRRPPSPGTSVYKSNKKSETPKKEINQRKDQAEEGSSREFLNEKIGSQKAGWTAPYNAGSESDDRVFKRKKKASLESIGLYRNEFIEYRNLREMEKEVSRKKELQLKMSVIKYSDSSFNSVFKMERTTGFVPYRDANRPKKPTSLHVSPEVEKQTALSLPSTISVKNIELASCQSDDRPLVPIKGYEVTKQSSTKRKLKIEFIPQKEKEREELNTNTENFEVLQILNSEAPSTRKFNSRSIHSEDFKAKETGGKPEKKETSKEKRATLKPQITNSLTANFFASMKNQLKLQQERLNLRYLCYLSQKARDQEQKIFNSLQSSGTRQIVPSPEAKVQEKRPLKRKTSAGKINENPKVKPSDLKAGQQDQHIRIFLPGDREKKENLQESSGFQSHRKLEGNWLKTLKGDAKNFNSPSALQQEASRKNVFPDNLLQDNSRQDNMQESSRREHKLEGSKKDDRQEGPRRENAQGGMKRESLQDSFKRVNRQESLKRAPSGVKNKSNVNEQRQSKEFVFTENEVVLEPWIGIEDSSLDHSILS